MNVNEFLNQAGEPIVYNIWARTSRAGNLTIGCQIAQGIERGNSMNDRRSFLLSAGQGDLGARRTTAILNMNETRANVLLEKMGLEPISQEIKDQAAEGTVMIFSAKEENKIVLFNETGIFNIPVGIELTESPFQNPYTPNQQAVLNPETREFVEYTDPASGEVTTYYAHTEIAPASMIKQQFIADYFADPEARKFPVGVELQIASETKSTVKSAAGEVTVDQ